MRLLAAAVAALLPAALPYTRLANLDHHAAEILLAILFVLVLGSGLDRTRGDTVSPVRAAVVPGLVLAASLLVQLSLVVLIAVAAVTLLWPRKLELAPRFKYGTILFTTAFFAVLPWSLAYHLAGAPIRHHNFGLFQPALLAAAALATSAGWLLFTRSGSRSRLRTFLVVATLAALGGLLVIVIPEVLAGTSFLTASYSLWVTRIGESRSLFDLSLTDALSEVSGRLSPLALLLPVALFFWLRSGHRGSGLARALVAYTLVFLPLAMLQARFMPHLSLLVGLATATVTVALLGGRRTRPALATAVLCGAGVCLIPTLGQWRATDGATEGFRQARPVLEYLAAETPATSHYLEPLHAPEYGVAAVWAYGHFIKYHGRRPAVVDNFGDHVGDVGVIREALLETVESRALDRFNSLEVRYLLVGELAQTFSGIVPDDSQSERFIGGSWQSSRDDASVEFLPAILGTVLYRVSMQNGSGVLADQGQRYVPALEHFRLVAESDRRVELAPGKSIAAVRLFEIVPGARLRIEGHVPGQAAGIVASVRAPSGNAFPYLQSSVFDAAGAVELTIPYPTRDTPGASFIERAELWVENATLPIPAITADDVVKGKAIVVPQPDRHR